MDRSFLGHLVFAVAMVAAALVAWTMPQGGTESTVVMIGGSPERLREVVWQEERWRIVAQRQDQDVLVTAMRQAVPPKDSRANPAAPPADPAAPPADPAAPPADPGATPNESGTTLSRQEQIQSPTAEEQKPFPGTKAASELFSKLMPLRAARSLGKVTTEQEKSFGLDKPQGSLTLRFSGREEKVDVGNSTYGSSDLYVRNAAGEVFILAASAVATLRHGASSLIDRNLLGVPKEKIERLTLTAGDKGREVVQRFAEDKAKAFFADPAEPDQKLELVGNWLDKLLRLRVVEQVDQEPVGAPAVEIEFFGGNTSLDLVKIWSGGDRSLLAKAKRFRGMITVSKTEADSLLRDLDSALSEGR